MWNLLGCKTIQDYLDAYLKLDCALLARCSEYCRKIGFKTYKLDVVQFFTTPNMAALRITKAEVQLFTEREHLDMIEPAIRGGITSVFESGHIKANKRYLPGFNSEETSTFGLTLEANDLYGGALQEEMLPIGDFCFVFGISIGELPHHPESSSVGYFCEVDLEYSSEVHDQQQDYALAPEKTLVKDDWLSDYQSEVKQHYNLPENKVNRLLQTLFDKSKYFLHYKLLQFYVRLGLLIKKVHRILKFTQSKWHEPYITLNSAMRKRATNRFEQNYNKMMNNSVYGKTIESKRRGLKVDITRDVKKLQNLHQNSSSTNFKIFGENMAAICSRAKVIKWTTPTIVGATILDLSKLRMYGFHYDVMRANFWCSLLYSDTDSLLYKVETTDLYADLAKKKEVCKEFNFSNYPDNHLLYSHVNHSRVLKFKDEFACDYISEFIGLKPKMYSITSKSK